MLALRHDSTATVGAAVMAGTGVEPAHGVEHLYAGVRESTRRSWRDRFAERAADLPIEPDNTPTA